MEKILLVKGILDASVLNTLLFAGRFPRFGGKHCIDRVFFGHDGIWITAIVCVTLLLIALMVYKLVEKKLTNSTKPGNGETVSEVKKTQEKDMKEAQYQELKLYRSQLANFMEKRAIKKETKYKEGEVQESVVREFDDDKSGEYIAKLEQFITSLSEKDEVKKLESPKEE